MTEEQVALVRETWERVASVGDSAVDNFYARLFDIDPGLRPLFTTDMRKQGRKLMAVITSVVHATDTRDQAMPAIRALGRRHPGYGVRHEDYDTMGLALLWMLEQELGDDFTDEVHDAWATAYALLARTMEANTPVAIAA
jgi:hemoglobin-like flavoprotein